MLNKCYNIIMSLLALFSVSLVVLDFAGQIDLSVMPWPVLDTVVLLIFAADYAIRFFRSADRRQFFKENIFDLLAILPLNTALSLFRIFRVFRIFKAARVLRVLRLAKAAAFAGMLRRRAAELLRTNGFIYVLYLNGVLLLLSSLVMTVAEGMTFPDALWWSFVTCTTVGYGDISPESQVGRVVAVVLMLFGIGLLGMLTGAITTYFVRTHQDPPADSDDQDELEALIASASPEDHARILTVVRIMLHQ